MSVTPALSTQEWEKALDWQRRAIAHNQRAVTVEWWAYNRDSMEPHGTAALCLYGQPFGFTRRDVRLLLGDAACDDRQGYSATARVKRELADRIAALLPPGAE